MVQVCTWAKSFSLYHFLFGGSLLCICCTSIICRMRGDLVFSLKGTYLGLGYFLQILLNHYFTHDITFFLQPSGTRISLLKGHLAHSVTSSSALNTGKCNISMNDLDKSLELLYASLRLRVVSWPALLPGFREVSVNVLWAAREITGNQRTRL